MNKALLLAKTKAELLDMARRLGLRGISTLLKPELVDRIYEAQLARTGPKPKQPLGVVAVAKKMAATVKRRAVRRREPPAAAAKPTRAKPAPVDVAAHKFEVTPPAQPIAQKFPAEPRAELPESYGTGRLFLVARDPRWLYAYWDLSGAQMANYRKQAADGQLLLRVFEKNHTRPAQEITLTAEARNWYLNVHKPATTFTAQLGYRRRGGGFHVISQSGEATTPAEDASAERSAQFVTVPMSLSFRDLSALLRERAEDGTQLAFTLRRLQAEGYRLPFKVEVELDPWSDEQTAALKRAIGGDALKRTQIGSEEIGEWLRRQLQEQVSSAMSSGVFSAFSPGASWQAAPAGKGFWFAVNAELIIYGTTERDANVTIDGKPIQLRPDGTFSYHYVLPDGQYRLPVVAVSRDGADRREATLNFERRTELRGAVGKVKQPEHLKAPAAA